MRPLGPPHAPGSMQHPNATRNNSCPVESGGETCSRFLLVDPGHAGWKRSMRKAALQKFTAVTSFAALKCNGIVSRFRAA
jgi:hypothetical protein